MYTAGDPFNTLLFSVDFRIYESINSFVEFNLK